MEDVRVMETSVVVPSKATPGGRLCVSSLDVQMAARGYVSAIYLYGDGHGPDAAATGRLTAALADALVLFYPLAGRLAADGTGRPVIDCNAEGALFVVACSDVLTAEDVRQFDPMAELRRLFVPSIDSAVGAMLAAQVSRQPFLCSVVKYTLRLVP
jgi:shikimate O-hydroxycinnamoyltransferase